MGYHRAGFDIVGVDIKPQPHYPFPFVLADVMGLDLSLGDWDAIHASPPCQAYSPTRNMHNVIYPDRLPIVRKMLEATDKPWVIENVPGAPMRADYVLCGSMFGLPRLRRHRWFETSWHGFSLTTPCRHDFKTVSVFGHSDALLGTVQECRDAMGIDWMTHYELAQAIPPAYTEYIGHELVQSTARPVRPGPPHYRSQEQGGRQAAG